MPGTDEEKAREALANEVLQCLNISGTKRPHCSFRLHKENLPELDSVAYRTEPGNLPVFP